MMWTIVFHHADGAVQVVGTKSGLAFSTRESAEAHCRKVEKKFGETEWDFQVQPIIRLVNLLDMEDIDA